MRTKALIGKKIHIKVNISENANQNNPIAFDLLFVYDKGLLKKILTMSAREWFKRKPQITKDNILGKDMDYWSWEWVPGQKVPILSLPLKPKAKGGVIFVNYFSPVEHRIKIDPFKDLVVDLREREVVVRY